MPCFVNTRVAKVIFAPCKKLGIGDHIVTWSKPKHRPNGMSADEFTALPDQVQVREVHLLIRQKGFRPKEIIVVTTLLDPKMYSKAVLAQLYHWRWQVEVDLRHVKTTLGMEMLRGKTPEMVRKEIYAHLMAYNLLRALMWEAAREGWGFSLESLFTRHASASEEFHLQGAQMRHPDSANGSIGLCCK